MYFSIKMSSYQNSLSNNVFVV